MNDCSVIIPTRNNLDYANRAVNCVLNNSNCRVILIDDHSGPILNYFRNERVNIIFNTYKQSLAQLWNQGILASRTDNVIIMSHRSRPEKQAFYKFFELLNRKYSFVGIKGFHFFGFNKYLMSIMGLFDSSFLSANYEDNDFVLRNFEHNLGYYLNDIQEIHEEGESSWSKVYTQSNKDYFNSKWEFDLDKGFLIKNKLENNYNSKELFSNYKKLEYLEFNETIDSYRDAHYPYLYLNKLKLKKNFS